MEVVEFGYKPEYRWDPDVFVSTCNQWKLCLNICSELEILTAKLLCNVKEWYGEVLESKGAIFFNCLLCEQKVFFFLCDV